jgi:hypothetical protein
VIGSGATVRKALPFLVPALGLAAVVLVLAPGRLLAEPPARRSLMDEPTRKAIERGLRYLAEKQNADGSWTSDAGNKVNDDYVVNEKGQNVHHVGVTSLGILAFLAAGHVPGRGPHGAVVDRAVSFVLSRVQPSGFIAADQTRMYSHAFATLALAEVYGMSRAPALREKLQSAVEFTIKCQNDTGGWRYVPFTVDSDMSVTVCQVVALRAARNVGIRVPQSTIDRALRYVVESAITSEDGGSGPDEVGAFLYQPSSTRFNRSSFSLTAAGLTTLFQAGLYDNDALATYVKRRGIRKSPIPRVDDTVNYMRRHYRSVRSNPEHYYYYYGNYYAAQAMYNVGGKEPEIWEKWYEMVRRDLLELQRVQNGPDGAGPAYSWWQSNVGRQQNFFATAVAILILSMPFDYLPIHQR